MRERQHPSLILRLFLGKIIAIIHSATSLTPNCVLENPSRKLSTIGRCVPDQRSIGVKLLGSMKAREQ